MNGYTKNSIVMGAAAGSMPPWTDAQRDAQIEALRYAYVELARVLHEAGVLDMQHLLPGLGNADWIYKDRSPDTYAAVMWLADTIEYTRAKIGPLAKKAAKASVKKSRD